ncbi:MAG: radical SAM protein [Nitrososphaeria archaeon]|nr:radical SAM protein [Aigarchaeota archaeon]MCX8187190.1 radical SAM protein [Nitrososphaeria archaeon]MDW8021780.1 radical SAM protein [Nitrososphaerota archaeon]
MVQAVVGKEEARVVGETFSVCPECNALVSAKLVEEDGKIYIEKICPEHGEVVELYFGSSKMYHRFSKYAHDGKGVENPNVTTMNYTCPFDCGLCPGHMSHTALANIVVTNRCDLFCWYCFFFAERAGYVYEPSIEQIREMARNLKNMRPVPGNSVQLTGGEPALRDDLPEIIRVLKEEGFDHVQLNTNGIRLARDFEFFKRVKEEGVSTLYLSFDGVTPETNPKNHWEIPAVLENARKLGVGIVLVPTVIKSVNDHELGDMIRFGFENADIVRSVNFQPVSLVGRMPRKERERFRITIPDCIKLIEEQTGGEIPEDAWFPVPSCTPVTHLVEAITNRPQYELSAHFVCGAGTYVFKDGGRMIPITSFIDVDGFLKYLQDTVDSIKAGANKYMTLAKFIWDLGKFINEEKKPSGLNVRRLLFKIFIKHDYRSLGEWHRRSLFLGMMHFMDKYNYDVERVRRCCIHYLLPDNRVIPFCAFNVLPEVYRDVIQKGYGIPIDEWERVTGKNAREYYRRVLSPSQE